MRAPRKIFATGTSPDLIKATLTAALSAQARDYESDWTGIEAEQQLCPPKRDKYRFQSTRRQTMGDRIKTFRTSDQSILHISKKFGNPIPAGTDRVCLFLPAYPNVKSAQTDFFDCDAVSQDIVRASKAGLTSVLIVLMNGLSLFYSAPPPMDDLDQWDRFRSGEGMAGVPIVSASQPAAWGPAFETADLNWSRRLSSVAVLARHNNLRCATLPVAQYGFHIKTRMTYHAGAINTEFTPYNMRALVQAMCIPDLAVVPNCLGGVFR